MTALVIPSVVGNFFLYFLMKNKKNRSVSTAEEDYLEAIQELIETRGYAKVIEIAEKLNLKGPSVTRMVQRLSKAGYLKYEKYRGIVMTDLGRATATEMQRRHALLRRFLIGLGVDSKTADADAEGMEHHVSPKTLKCLSEWLEKSDRTAKKN
jgi:Mn-dependent DtxR family transcriptional regulator